MKVDIKLTLLKQIQSLQDVPAFTYKSKEHYLHCKIYIIHHPMENIFYMKEIVICSSVLFEFLFGPISMYLNVPDPFLFQVNEKV